MLDLRQAPAFRRWLADLPDIRARERITKRLIRMDSGLFGDVRSVGHGVSEIRVDEGQGYRLYFTRRGTAIIPLLLGGDKSTQARDITLAQGLARDLLRFLMPLKTIPFESAEHLESHEGQIGLLSDAASTGDAAYIRHALNVVSRARGMTDIAREAGVSRRVLFDAILDEEQTGVDALLKIFRALGASTQDTKAAAAE